MKNNNDENNLKKLREPFPLHQVSKLPKPTKEQTDAVRADYKLGIRCSLCGSWHHKDVIHLDYVGHAALTDRLLDVDPYWSWEPLALDSNGLPLLDKDGGLWIKLTVCGVTRLGYGDAQGKTGGDAMKERVGDALRNSAMRFGAALDLWHKGDLHVEEKSPVYCTSEKFEANAYVWRKIVESGRKTADDLIAFANSKALLTDDQINTIKSWEIKNENV